MSLPDDSEPIVILDDEPTEIPIKGTTMSLLDQVITGPRLLPPRVLLYGTDKVGKSTFAAGAPSPIVIQAEEGSDEIGTPRLPLCEDFTALLAQLTSLAMDEHHYKTAIFDSSDWIERLIWAHVCQKENVSGIEKVGGGYGKGYTAAAEQWRILLDGQKYLRDKRGMCIINICHHEVKTSNLPDSDPYDRYQPKLQKYAMGMLKEWHDAILFAGYKVHTKTVELGSKSVAKAIGRGDRVLYCTEKPTHVAGNRYGIPETIDFPPVGGFDVFSSYVNAFFAQTAPK